MAAKMVTLEQDVGEVRTDVAGLKTDVRHLTEAVVTLTKGIENLNTRMSQSQRTPWQAVGVMVTAVGLLVALGAYGPLSTLDRHDRWIESTDGNRFTDADARRLDEQHERQTELMLAPITSAIGRLEEAAHDGMRNQWTHEHQDDWVRSTYHRDIDAVKDDLRELQRRFEEHMGDGHPARVVASVTALAARVERLETLVLSGD